MKEEYANGVIRHFESAQKPWKTERNGFNNAQIKNTDEFWQYAQMTPYIYWFERKYNLLNVCSKYPTYENKKALGSRSFRLLGIIPILRIRRKRNKTSYLVFNFIPVITGKSKNNDKKQVWRLFDLITLLIIKK